MRYQRVRLISGRGTGPAQFTEELRGLAVDARDRIYTVGDSAAKVFSPTGELLARWRTERPGYAVAVAADGTIFVGQPGQVQLFDSNGRLVRTWNDPERLGLVTAIGFAGQNVLVADTKDRCLRCYDREGRFLRTIGKDGRLRGFLIPNGHLDLAVDAQGVIHVPNPGKHRVERYSLEGQLLGHFGRFDGRDPAGFSGCCNPTNIALTADGQIVVTEKAPPRVKIYQADGGLVAVMGEDDFDLRCKNMDVAVDSRGLIYVIDTARLHVCVFASDQTVAADVSSAEKTEGTTSPATQEGVAP